jgi:hypothetical protein
VILAGAASPVYAFDAPYRLPRSMITISKDKTMDLSIEEAVEYGLEHSTKIQTLDNTIDLARITFRVADDNSDALIDADRLLEEGEDELEANKELLDQGQRAYDMAYAMWQADTTPSDLTVLDSEGNPVVIPAGTVIKTALMDLGYVDPVLTATDEAILAGIKNELEDTLAEIDEGLVMYNEGSELLEMKKEEMAIAIDEVSDELDTKLNFSSIVTFDADDASELMLTMAGVNFNVSKYAKEIYENQVAMLIQKNYYDALYAKKVLELKEKAQERGEVQYKLIELSYENGMKSKDDLLLSRMYFNSTTIAKRMAESTYNNALTEMKKNMNMNLGNEVILTDKMDIEITDEDLSEGLKSGMTNRIEMQKCLGQLMIYRINEDIVKDMNSHSHDDHAEDEAELFKIGAEIELEETRQTVMTEIYQSYELLKATEDMLKESENLIHDAEEVVAIAQLKFDQGFGSDNALLQNLNLESSSGTIVELIAAQENLSDVESQVANIRYNYSMAKVKYYNDAALLELLK